MPGDSLPWKCLRIEMGVWLVISVAGRGPSACVNKVAHYFYYIPNAPELILECVRTKQFPGASPQTPGHYNLAYSGPVHFSSAKALVPVAVKGGWSLCGYFA